MDAPVDGSCLEMTEVSRETKIRLGLSKKASAVVARPVEEGNIDELLKNINR